jgi:hypothetical protein
MTEQKGTCITNIWDEEIDPNTPGISKASSDFILPTIRIDKDLCGEVGIYFLQDRDGHIKIGQTSHLFKRMSAYRTHNSVIRLVGFICTGQDYLNYNENILHRLWEMFVITGEWFAPVRPIIQYISYFRGGIGSPMECYRREPAIYEELLNQQKIFYEMEASR